SDFLHRRELLVTPYTTVLCSWLLGFFHGTRFVAFGNLLRGHRGPQCRRSGREPLHIPQIQNFAPRSFFERGGLVSGQVMLEHSCLYVFESWRSSVLT